MILAVLFLSAVPLVDLNRLPADAMKPARDFHHADVRMSPACSVSELERLQKETRLLVSEDAQGAWDVAMTMLCGTRDSSIRYLSRHMPKKVLFVDLLGTEYGFENELRPRESIAMLRGKAWQARVEYESEMLEFSYNTNDICQGSFSLRHVQRSWLLVRFGETCL